MGGFDLYSNPAQRMGQRIVEFPCQAIALSADGQLFALDRLATELAIGRG